LYDSEGDRAVGCGLVALYVDTNVSVGCFTSIFMTKWMLPTNSPRLASLSPQEPQILLCNKLSEGPINVFLQHEVLAPETKVRNIVIKMKFFSFKFL
jgi:hypothetical protein